MKKIFTLIASALVSFSAFADEAVQLFTATALVYLPGLDQEVQRTIVGMSDSTFIIQEMYGEGSNDVTLKVDAKGHVDFAGAKMDSYYYTWNNITGSNSVTNIWAYAAYSYSWTLDNNGEYYKLPGKLGGELIIQYTGAYNGNDAVGTNNKKMYVCWGRTRLNGTKQWPGIATLCGTPATEGTLDGNWASTDKASIGFYYDELKGDTIYRIDNWYGYDKYFHFRTTENGKLSFVNNYIYTGDENVYYLYATDSYSYTYGDNNYYVTDLTKVLNGEIGFFAYAYDQNNAYVNYYSADWQKNYYTFRWENTDNAATGLNVSPKTSATSSAKKQVKNGKIVVVKNGKTYDLLGKEIK